MEAVVERAHVAGCYKVILDCSDANATFYTKCGLSHKDIQMVSAQQLACSTSVQIYVPMELTAGYRIAQVKYF